jgi:hypothetical protein
MAKKTRKCVYEVRPGRQIYLNGKPYISISGEGDPRDASPYAVDRLTHKIAEWLQRKGCLRVSAIRSTEHWSR